MVDMPRCRRSFARSATCMQSVRQHSSRMVGHRPQCGMVGMLRSDRGWAGVFKLEVWCCGVAPNWKSATADVR